MLWVTRSAVLAAHRAACLPTQWGRRLSSDSSEENMPPNFIEFDSWKPLGCRPDLALDCHRRAVAIALFAPTHS